MQIHPIYEELRRLVIGRLDKIEKKDIRFDLYDDDDEVKSVYPAEKRLLSQRLGIEFIYTFEESRYVKKTEIFLYDILFSEMLKPTKIKEGYSLRTVIQFK